jgi:hypothetical protein
MVIDAFAASDADVRALGYTEAVSLSVGRLRWIADAAVLSLVELASHKRIRRLFGHTANLRAFEITVHRRRFRSRLRGPDF